MSSKGTRQTAPVPSPRRISAKMSGFSLAACITQSKAGSAEAWLAIMNGAHSGQMRWATKAATALMKPSTSTGTRCSAPPMNRPAMPAMSNPPSLARTSSASSGLGWFSAMARSMASSLRARPSSESPAPRPVIVWGGSPSSTEATALDVVVLPIPISPVSSRP